MSTGRTYSEREVAQIIERAVERQVEARRDGAETGLTMDELERLGREVGIDPRHLRAAAAEIGAGAGRASGHTHTQVHVERWIEGPLSVTAWEDTIGALRDRFGMDAGVLSGNSTGGISQVGNTYEWTHTSALGVQTRVTVSSRGDRTRLRLTQLVGIARPEIEAPLWGGVLTLLAGLFPAMALFPDSIPMMIAFTALVFVIASGAVLVADRSWRAHRLRDLESVADMVTVRLLSPPEETVAPSERAITGSIDLDALPDAEPPEWTGHRERERE